ncbi:hypothetical protein [Pseudobythopirellula maris]|uniref:hypothetical protein n=1 Tax=Pseudobythopirellula maris TaxID=2527991 RepID=UPI0011B383C9|nr:hypothetical protein [Pseudobythopirellula maris]
MSTIINQINSIQVAAIRGIGAAVTAIGCTVIGVSASLRALFERSHVGVMRGGWLSDGWRGAMPCPAPAAACCRRSAARSVYDVSVAALVPVKRVRRSGSSRDSVSRSIVS